MKTTPFWHEAAPPEEPSGAEAPAEADVVIVGAGFTGLSCALALARDGPRGGGVGGRTARGRGLDSQWRHVRLGPPRQHRLLRQALWRGDRNRGAARGANIAGVQPRPDRALSARLCTVRPGALWPSVRPGISTGWRAGLKPRRQGSGWWRTSCRNPSNTRILPPTFTQAASTCRSTAHKTRWEARRRKSATRIFSRA